MQKMKNPHLPLRVLLSLRERIEVRSLWRPKLIIYAFIVFVAVSCETANYAPVVTAPSKGAATKLEQGRDLFVHRCIECHTLPPIWKYSRQDWPQIVKDMSHRASLKPGDRDAVVAYILAVRATER
jgi:mono/diheme cytochrome c family protein